MHLTRTCFLVLAATIVVAAANDVANSENVIDDISPESRVIGGEDAQPKQFPYQVSLRTFLLRQHFCGGSIISSRHILTAAHCTVSRSPRFVRVVVGALNRKHDGIQYRLEKIFNHPNYDQNQIQHDIALLKTKSEIVFSDVVRQIGLPISDPANGMGAFVSGWGQIMHPPRPGQSLLPSVLQFKKTFTLASEPCASLFKGYPQESFITNGNICTKNPKFKGVCMGDSGGPLVAENRTVLIGVVSWGVPCAQGYPDVYTNVFTYYDWIKEHMDM